MVREKRKERKRRSRGIKSQNLIVAEGLGDQYSRYSSPYVQLATKNTFLFNIFSLEAYPILFFSLCHISMVKLLNKWSENFKINMLRLRIMLAETSWIHSYTDTHTLHWKNMFKVKEDRDEAIRIGLLNKKLKFALCSAMSSKIIWLTILIIIHGKAIRFTFECIQIMIWIHMKWCILFLLKLRK